MCGTPAYSWTRTFQSGLLATAVANFGPTSMSYRCAVSFGYSEFALHAVYLTARLVIFRDTPNSIAPGHYRDRWLLNLPKTMRQQIGKPHEPLPTCGCPCQPMIEACIKDERFPCRIAEGPKISDGIAL
jgi:hypothetical protein